MKTIIKISIISFIFLIAGLVINTKSAEASITCTKYDPTFSETWQESTCKSRANDTYYCSNTTTVSNNEITGACNKRNNANTCSGNSSCGRTLATDVTCRTFDRNDDGEISRSECVETQHYEWNFDGCQCNDVGGNDNGGGGGGGGGGGNTCSCTDWNNGSCGGGSCGAGSVRQTRTCTNNCADEVRCLQKDWCTKPDLDITAFKFYGGRENTKTGTATVTIRNTGNEAITQNFKVTVYNKKFAPRASKSWSISQRVGAGEKLSHTFTDFQIPSEGDYTAQAIVDSDNTVKNEASENNNTATDDYVSTTPPKFDITGTVFIDEDNSKTLNAGDVRVGAAIISRRQGTENFAHNVTTCNAQSCSAGRNRGDYLMGGLSQGNYDVRLDPASLPANTQLAGGVTNPRVGVALDQDRTVNFRLVRSNVATYDISGGLFLDANKDGIKQSGEAYTDGSATSPRRTVTSGAQSASAGPFNFTNFTAAGSPYTVTVQAAPAGFRYTYPANGATSVAVNVGAGCVENVHWDCVTGDVQNLNFGITDNSQVAQWIQSEGGDIRADNGLDSIVPGDNLISRSSSTMTSGIIIGSGLNIGGPSKAKWYVDNSVFAPSSVKTSYAQVVSNLQKGGVWDSAITMFSGADRSCTGTNQANGFCTLKDPLPQGIYKANRDVTIEGGNYAFAGGGDYIFIIDGNLTLTNNISVPVGTTVMFVVKGNITVANNVTAIAGIYSADGNFTIQNPGGGVAGAKLTIQGNVIANADLRNRQTVPQVAGNFINNRDLKAGNATNPSVEFIYRPDFVINAPDVFKYPTYKIQEIAPGN